MKKFPTSKQHLPRILRIYNLNGDSNEKIEKKKKKGKGAKDKQLNKISE